MTEIRMGIDVVSIPRLVERLSEWPGLAPRIFTEGELSYSRGRPDPGQHLAVRFAAKEATFKALGCGWPSVSWLEVEVVGEEGGPGLKVSGKAASRAGDCKPLVSLSHDGGIAIAQVLLVPA